MLYHSTISTLLPPTMLLCNFLGGVCIESHLLFYELFQSSSIYEHVAEGMQWVTSAFKSTNGKYPTTYHLLFMLQIFAGKVVTLFPYKCNMLVFFSSPHRSAYAIRYRHLVVLQTLLKSDLKSFKSYWKRQLVVASVFFFVTTTQSNHLNCSCGANQILGKAAERSFSRNVSKK